MIARCGFGALLVTLAIAGLAVGTSEPLLFPSLGPTAYLLFATPTHPAASPRNTLAGHLIGVAAGAAGLTAFGLWHTEAALSHMDWARAGAATMALTLTCAGMALSRLPHPPAGATTLIVALGVLHTPKQLGLILLGVVVLLVLGAVFNRAVGVRYPLWKAETPESQEETARVGA
ncbi:HPP family protein [Actinokineospora auranticolor]|uniref:HPP family protein n=1 Tax=Actinokineospora auranticolor TaxID=155976 RepID=A0A2S6H104_9PSEU|nr:HPP family protein [Actinokineospora auranticolor]PPK71111.1 HPP family protein [Actinokineospora auranticolor]